MTGLPEIVENRRLTAPADNQGGEYYLALACVVRQDEPFPEGLKPELDRRLKEFLVEATEHGPLIERQAPTYQQETLLESRAISITAWVRGMILPPNLSPEAEADARRMFNEMTVRH